MRSDAETVKAYLNDHQEWFVRCAKPIKAEPIGDNSYALRIGRFGALGFYLEPTFGVVLLPEENGIYRMETVPLETNDSYSYEIDYQAQLQLVEQIDDHKYHPMTEVQWSLDLGVVIAFPKFIYRFSYSFIQKTGDRLLAKIVNQISKRLTYKVQMDFHSRYLKQAQEVNNSIKDLD